MTGESLFFGMKDMNLACQCKLMKLANDNTCSPAFPPRDSGASFNTSSTDTAFGVCDRIATEATATIVRTGSTRLTGFACSISITRGGWCARRTFCRRVFGGQARWVSRGLKSRSLCRWSLRWFSCR